MPAPQIPDQRQRQHGAAYLHPSRQFGDKTAQNYRMPTPVSVRDDLQGNVENPRINRRMRGETPDQAKLVRWHTLSAALNRTVEYQNDQSAFVRYRTELWRIQPQACQIPP